VASLTITHADPSTLSGATPPSSMTGTLTLTRLSGVLSRRGFCDDNNVYDV
jgi:hypothetical protein